MSTIALRPQSRFLLLQRRINACHQCRASSLRWHSSVNNHNNNDKKGGGFEALRKKLTSHLSDKLRDLPDKPARTRFAPSPTGYLHIGSLRTALYNWLLARATGGQFIIRIEDTDRLRTVKDAVPRLLSDLKWAELNWDEGPDIGGRCGPYVQSQRLFLYNEHVTKLLETGHAFRCFCKAHDLERHKEQSLDAGGAFHYPGTCRDIPPSEAERRSAAGETHVVRFRAAGRPSFEDAVYGSYQKNEDEDDFILCKSDGYPTYHFANVVDDHFMDITHVIRGAEWLISTPKHIALYDALGWKPPVFAHVGLLCAPNGEKLSKRNNDIDISSYRDKGILPSALNNWLALLGWSSMNEEDFAKNKHEEVFYTINDLAEKFSLRFTTGNIKANPDKLSVFQRKHLTRRLCSENLSVADSALIRDTIVPQTRALLNRISDIINSKQEEQLTSPINHRHAFSTTDFSCLIPVLDDANTANDHILRTMRILAADSPIDPEGLVYQHPSLFFRPSPSAYARHTYSRSLYKMKSLEDFSVKPEQILAELKATFEAVPQTDWGIVRLQGVLNDFGKRYTAGLEGQEAEEMKMATLKAAYTLLRLVLTGDPTRGAKPTKLQLCLLGKPETLLRLKMCGADDEL